MVHLSQLSSLRELAPHCQGCQRKGQATLKERFEWLGSPCSTKYSRTFPPMMQRMLQVLYHVQPHCQKQNKK